MGRRFGGAVDRFHPALTGKRRVTGKERRDVSIWPNTEQHQIEWRISSGPQELFVVNGRLLQVIGGAQGKQLIRRKMRRLEPQLSGQSKVGQGIAEWHRAFVTPKDLQVLR